MYVCIFKSCGWSMTLGKSPSLSSNIHRNDVYSSGVVWIFLLLLLLCSFATLKNWNTQKQFRELDSVTFKLPRKSLPLSPFWLIYFPGRVLLEPILLWACYIWPKWKWRKQNRRYQGKMHWACFPHLDYLPVISQPCDAIKAPQCLFSQLLQLSLYHNDDTFCNIHQGTLIYVLDFFPFNRNREGKKKIKWALRKFSFASWINKSSKGK